MIQYPGCNHQEEMVYLHPFDPLSEQQCTRAFCHGIRIGINGAYD